MAEYDVAITGGRILDGAGNPWFYADIGIKDGRIAKVGRIEARRDDGIAQEGGEHGGGLCTFASVPAQVGIQFLVQLSQPG